MKIALVILHADPMRGGAERYTVDLAAALARRGHDVTLASSAAIADSFRIEKNPTEHYQSAKLGSTGLTRTGRYREFLKSLDSLIDAQHFDIVHAMLPVHRCHVYHPHAGIAALRHSPLKNLFNPRRSAMAEVERNLMNSPHPPRILCLSEYVKSSVRQAYALDDAHLPILFNAVNTDRFFHEPNRNSDRITALIIAQDLERKGLRQAIEAIAQVNDPRLVLRVIGKESTGSYEQLAAKLGISRQIEFAGPTLNPVEEYHKADFFVLPTKHDPCSLVVLEALASGLPVISTRFNGACEIMTDGIQGFVLDDHQNVPAIAAAMQKLLDPALRDRMSKACVELRPRLSYEHHLDRLMQIYEQSAVESRGNSSPVTF